MILGEFWDAPGRVLHRRRERRRVKAQTTLLRGSENCRKLKPVIGHRLSQLRSAFTLSQLRSAHGATALASVRLEGLVKLKQLPQQAIAA